MKEQNFSLTTPVLFLVFNRLNTTKKVLTEIRKAKPKQLFIAADGPRNLKEKKKTNAVRRYILNNIDWDCEIKTLFREKNLGCKYAVAGAIDWFFKNVEQGIILEDDCLPSQSFFRFCHELLKKYKENKRIIQISGTNMEGKSPISEDYFFAKHFNPWGWATWKRAWEKYDVEMKDWKKYKLRIFKFMKYYGFLMRIKSWRAYNLTYNGIIDTWDHQWGFVCLIKDNLCIIPQKNLITNIGFGSGTHTKSRETNQMRLKRYELSFPLKENNKIIESKRYLLSVIKTFRRYTYQNVLSVLKNRSN